MDTCEAKFYSFKNFGSLCSKYLLEQLRKKLDDKGWTMILVSCHSTGVYKFFSDNMNKVVISRDVQFDESKGWS